MPRSEPVTEQAVFDACDAITAEGERPTLESVRAKVGGSYNTLSPMIKRWRGQQASQAAAALEMPDTVLASLKGLAAELWKVASAEAQARTKSIEDAAEKRAGEAESEAAELLSAVQRLEAELATAKATATAQTQELEKSNARNDQLQAELVSLAREMSGKS